MADRSIVVRLRAETSQFRSEMNAAAASSEKAGNAAQATGRQVQASAEQIERAAQRVSNARRQELDASARLNTAEKRLDEVKRNSKSTAAQIAAAEERALTSRSRLEKATEGLVSAEKQYAQAMQVASKQAQSSQSAFGRLAKQAEANSEAWTAAGTAMTVFGGAIVGVGVAAAKTGGEYNTLQQTTRAALKTLMGGAREANVQMDKLDAFARNSPFAKQIFIQAQQQLIGFGVEAKKVIPYLGAIQDAVAATGGGNQQIKEIVETMSKIQSASKITGQDLIEFGNRGIDAAGLIGSQMGKTGAQIRDDITNGALGAEEALDALTAGMSQKFGGAAAGVKATMTGALDRVKSAWRDLSASMVEPFVSKNGGGMAVDWLNSIADKMREFEGLDAPVRNTMLALGGVVGVGSLAAGSFLALAPRIVETKKALDTLAAGGGILGKATSGIGLLSKGLVIATAAWGAFQGANWLANKVTKASIPDLEKINTELREMSKNGGDLTGAFNNSNSFLDWAGGSQSVRDMGDALEIVGLRSEQGITGLAKFREAITPGRQELERATDGIKAYDEGLASLVKDGKMDEAQTAFKSIAELIPEGMPQEEVMTQFAKYREALQATANDLDVTGLSEKDYYEWMRGNVPDAIEQAVEAQKSAADGYTGMSAAAQAAQEHLEGVRSSLIDSANGFLDFSAKATESKTSLREWINDMEEQVEAQANWLTNLETIANRGAPQALLDQLMSMGTEGAGMVKKLAEGSDEDMQRVIDVFSKSKRNVNDFANSVAGIPVIDLDADPTKLREQIADSKSRLEELKKLPTSPEISAQITLLEEKIREAEGKLDGLEKKPTTAKVDANTKPAKDEVNGFRGWFKEHSTVTMTVITKIKEAFEKAKPDSSGPAGAGSAIRKYRNRKEPQYYGGILTPMAAGGFTGAEMVKPNTWRVVGDRMDVDEAYIPLDGSRRSKDILLEAIARMPGLGMAKGGIVGKSAEAKRADEEERKLARERLQRVRELRAELRQDLRRGSIRDQVTGGLSGGYSAIDRLAGLGSEDALGRGSRSRASSSARRFESNLRSLYAQAERIDEKLKAAKDKAQELEGIKNSVASGFMRERDLDFSTTTVEKNGNYYQSSKLGGLSSKVQGMRSLAEKLGRLAKAGMPGTLLQEIAGMGIDGGNQAADALLGASKQEQSTYVSAWGEFEKYANLAGSNVTLGFYKGGINAAQGVVKGLESQQKNVESSIANLAKAIEATFRSVLGIHSPSTVMAALGGNTAEGLVQGMLAGVTDVQSAASILGDAAVSGAFPPVDEAIRQMPGFTTSTTPEGTDATAPTEGDPMMVGGIPVPDTTPITDAWQAMFDTMLATTIAGWAAQVEQQTLAQTTLQTLLAEHQATTLTAYQTHYTSLGTLVTGQYAAMNASVLAALQLQHEQVSTGFTSQQTTMDTILTTMGQVLSDKWSGMSLSQSGYLSGMQTNADTGFTAIKTGGEDQMSALARAVSREMGTLPTETGSALRDTRGVLNEFAEAVNEAFGELGVELPKVPAFREGGPVSGPGTGRSDSILARVSNGEFIMPADRTASYYPILEAMRSGDYPAYAGGGLVDLEAAARWLQGQNVRISEFGAWGQRVGGHAPGSWHYKPPGLAFDANAGPGGQNATEMRIFDRLVPMINSMWPSLRTLWRVAGHFNHLHVDAGGSGAPSGVGAGLLGALGGAMPSDMGDAYAMAAKKVGGDLVKKFSGKLPDHPIAGDLGSGVMETVVESLIKKARDFGDFMVEPDGDTGGGVERWRPTVMAALQRVGLPLTEEYIQAWLRQIMSESGGNPGIVQGVQDVNSGGNEAVGLVQVIPGTFAAFRDKSLPNDRRHPLANLVAGMNWAIYKYGRDHLDVIGHGHGYADGTPSARRGWAWVGEEGPELVNFGGGEEVIPHRQSMEIQNRTFIPNTAPSFNPADIGKVIAAELKRGQFTPNDLARVFDGLPMRLVLDDGRSFDAHISTQVGRLARSAGRAH